MHNFVSLTECLNSPNAACAFSPPSLGLYAVIFVSAILAWSAERRGAEHGPRAIRRMLAVGALLMVLSFLTVIGFFMFDPDAPLGVEDNVVSEAFWLLAVNAFGLGVMILLGTAGYGLGSRAARIFRRRGRGENQP